MWRNVFRLINVLVTANKTISKETIISNLPFQNTFKFGLMAMNVYTDSKSVVGAFPTKGKHLIHPKNQTTFFDECS